MRAGHAIIKVPQIGKKLIDNKRPLKVLGP